jgi:hypothetical protein
VVTFFGNVHGLVPLAELQRWGVKQHPSKAYSLGQATRALRTLRRPRADAARPLSQVVRCQVLKSDPSRGRMLLTFDLTK